MNEKVSFLCAATILVSMSLGAQSSDLMLTASPTLSFPVGPVVDGDLPLYGIGGGASLKADYSHSAVGFAFGRASFDFEMLPLKGSERSIQFLSAGVSAGAQLPLSPRFSAKAAAGGGFYLAASELGTVSNPFAEGGAGVELRMSPSTSIEIGAKYRHFFTPSGTLYQGIALQLGYGYNLSGSRKGTEIRLEPNFAPIFPLFYAYYDKHPAGEVVLSNPEGIPYEKVRVSFLVKQYMDGPRLCAEFPVLKSRESRTVPVYALFNGSIFRVTEGTKAAGEVLVEYFYMGKERSRSFPVTVSVQNRNAMTWDDDRKAAAFVTAKDPVILAFAKNTASVVRYQGSPPVSENFRTAMSIFQTLTLYGLGYAPDPKTPYVTLSGSENAVDFLQFPNQTLAYRGGDCDDLSVLYCALLEAVGIPTALVTTPGHIFAAFDAGVPPERAAEFFPGPGDAIIRDGKVWIPVEVTLVRDGFVRAWQTGGRQWTEAEGARKAGFYPIAEAWKTYEPVGFAEGVAAVVLPQSESIISVYRSEIGRLLDSHVAPLISEAQAKDKAAGKRSEQVDNRAGILLAKFGMLDKAAERFRTAAKAGAYSPAIINLGNVFYLQGDMKAAADQYARALAVSPRNVVALAGSAKALYALREFPKSDAAMEKLKAIDPQLAANVDLKGGAVVVERASEAASREVESWDE